MILFFTFVFKQGQVGLLLMPLSLFATRFLTSKVIGWQLLEIDGPLKALILKMINVLCQSQGQQQHSCESGIHNCHFYK
jgi:hypothetical protein